MIVNNILGDNIGYIELLDHMGSDLTVVNTARVSFARHSSGTLDTRDIRLINYLAKHHHWTPFAHPQIQVRIKAPISVQRQWFKHKIGIAENSESTRYVNMDSEFYIPKNLRKQSMDNKQASDGDVDETYNRWFRRMAVEHYEKAVSLYKYMLNSNIAKEQARDVLPLATYTTWISTMSLYAAFNLWNQRTHDGAQWEIGQFAKGLESLIEPLFPESWKALKENI